MEELPALDGRGWSACPHLRCCFQQAQFSRKMTPWMPLLAEP